MPLIETVTYPDMVNPDEVMEAGDYIRFLNRSTGRVRTGPGAGREDVNVSCRGGSRVEIKGVSHNKWIPELTHNESFRQWALLAIKDELNSRIKDTSKWNINYEYLNFEQFKIKHEPIKFAMDNSYKMVAINLPEFRGILSHFTQPTKMFANEFADRLKVIACLEKPNMAHTEEFKTVITKTDLDIIKPLLKANDNDAQIIIWGPEDDMKTALEVIEERCRMAFEGVPEETRKSFIDGTTIFERVLPGADRMYPDTDSAPIPLEGAYIDKLGEDLPVEIVERYKQLREWGIPEDTYTFLLRKNLIPLMEDIIKDCKVSPKFIGTFLGHKLKFVEGHYKSTSDFSYSVIHKMFKFIFAEGLNINIANKMLPEVYEHPQMQFSSVLTNINFKPRTKESLLAPVGFLKDKYKEIGIKQTIKAETDWVMGELRKQALGNIDLNNLKKAILK